jgi:hypothetical protein
LNTRNKGIRTSLLIPRPHLFDSISGQKPNASAFGVDHKEASNHIDGLVKQIGHDNLSTIEAVATSAELAIQAEISQQFRQNLRQQTQVIAFGVVGHVHLPFALQPTRWRECNQKKTVVNEGHSGEFFYFPKARPLTGRGDQRRPVMAKLKNCLLERQPLRGCCVHSSASVLFWFGSLFSLIARAHGPPPISN